MFVTLKISRIDTFLFQVQLFWIQYAQVIIEFELLSHWKGSSLKYVRGRTILKEGGAIHNIVFRIHLHNWGLLMGNSFVMNYSA